MNWGSTRKENKPVPVAQCRKPRSYATRIKRDISWTLRQIAKEFVPQKISLLRGWLGRGKREMLGECQSSVLHNLFQIDWSTCKNRRRPFFLLDLHQYVKTKPEARETKRLLSEEMSCSIPLHVEVCVCAWVGSTTKQRPHQPGCRWGRWPKKVFGLLLSVVRKEGWWFYGDRWRWPPPSVASVPVAGSWSHLEAGASILHSPSTDKQWRMCFYQLLHLAILSQLQTMIFLKILVRERCNNNKSGKVWYFAQCVILHTLCSFTNSV